MSGNAEVVREFIKTWSTLDVDRIANFFTDDGVYHNMPVAPVAGRDRVRTFIAAFLKGWTATDWEILNIVESGEVVIAERIDRSKVDGKTVELPCCGVFEMEGGKIRVWRDYFDMATYTRALAG